MIIKIPQEKLLDLFLFLCLLFAAFLLLFTAAQLSAVPVIGEGALPCLVIDPGHGGIDGGAIAFNGIKESEINLAIGLKMQSLAEFLGVRTAMTREDDSSRSDTASYSEHEDLVKRAETVNTIQNAVLISVHQNFYPTSQPSGAQVLYASDERSRMLGELTQQNLVRHLQPENRRLSEPASKKLFLLSHVSCPAILVECGFLSNIGDLELLTQNKYQSSLAVILLGSFLQSQTLNSYT